MSSDSAARSQHARSGMLRGLVRSMSGKQRQDSSPVTTTTHMGEERKLLQMNLESVDVSAASGSPLQSIASTSSSPAERRLKISERLKQLGRDITTGKLRKHSDKSIPASPRITVGEFQQGDIIQTTGHAVVAEDSNRSELRTSSALEYNHAKQLSVVAEVAEPGQEPVVEVPNEGVPGATIPLEDPTEASTFAKRIQSLIDSLPFPTSGEKQPISAVKDPDSPSPNDAGRPIPPDIPSIQDSGLINLLSSPAIMNGSTSKGRPSIWSILERVGSPTQHAPLPSPFTAGDTNVDEPSDEHSIYSDNSSVMVYSPLIPTLDDQVELAELVPIEPDNVVLETETAIEGTSWTSVWPLSIWYGLPSRSTASPVESKSGLSPEPIPSSPTPNQGKEGNVVRSQTPRAWVPSNTKLSVQAMWWGYRLYLPPPVLEILSDKTLEATKRASMITTALTWFFNHLPIDALPPPLRPAALLLQRLAPFLGYIGTFISWSWSTIKSYDIGFGVTLTATWLLPVALIPGTWRENDFPKSPTQSPIALPPTSPPTSHALLDPILPDSPPATSPSLSYVTANQSTPSPRSVFIPVPPMPLDLPPIPPSPIPQLVPVGSPLMKELLKGPVLGPVPLPDEDAPSPMMPTVKPTTKNRAKAFFTRSPR
ncbi:hypothetical protein JR316_0001649 [Psilocybe cubensis]|uniref:Uncharacterized protein n=1 Tax=Psilocybe cubensis TaxID=181762 RepID=A0ACB8HAA1_PSICU|nr:hypothetical protein JR316_0001649 [Psilocybe cubensis]KAH9484749.1 hypothetical protein JR316_0001649 [Psilocybe cubensis]